MRSQNEFACRTALDPIAFAMAELKPRVVLTFGLPMALPSSEGRRIYAVAPDQDLGTTLEADLGQFLARKIGGGASRRPETFDLAVAVGYSEAAITRIVAALRELAHSRSTLLIVDGEAPAGAHVRLPIVGASPAAILVGDLDGAAMPPVSNECFLKRFSLSPVQPPASLKRVPNGPLVSGPVMVPRYNDIVLGHATDAGWPTSDGRAVGDWWGKPLQLLSVGISEAANVGLLNADGRNRSVLVGEDGGVLDASLSGIGGYGPPGTPSSVWKAPSLLVDEAGRRHPLQEAKALLANAPRHAGEVFLLGRMDRRFGHFLLESLARAWAIPWALERGTPILVWGKLSSYVRDAFALLGIPDDQLIEGRLGTVYERMVLPDPAHRLYGSISPAAAIAWNRMADAAVAAVPSPSSEHRFLYLSRAGTPDRSLLNEEALEDFLRSRGGLVARPETLGFTEQIALVRRARAVVGCSGSQMHLSMFARRGNAKLVIGNEHYIPPEETMIGLASGVTTDYYIERLGRSGKMRTEPWSIDMARFSPAFDAWLETSAIR